MQILTNLPTFYCVVLRCLTATSAAIVLFFLSGLSPFGQPPLASRKPNIVLILADDMGYGDIGSNGVKDIRTPHLDRLAREGVRLTACYSNGPVCTPTRAALMTGRWQQRVGLEWAITPADQEAGLPVSETSLARMLKDAGYRTAQFGKWHLGAKPEFNPIGHGFDEFFGILGGNVDMNSHRNRLGTPDLYEKTAPVEQAGYLTDLITDRAIRYIEQNGPQSPFFLYVPYNAVHWPFQPPGNPADVRTQETWLSGTRNDYARMLERMDEGIGRIIQALDRGRLAKDTLVIFTNDNGGERLSRNAPFFHHKETVWEGGIRVPCLLRWPGQLPAGKTSEQVAITMDLTATILAATGTQPPVGRTPDGINLLPILTGRQPITPRTLFWRIDRQNRKQKAVRQGDWKYLWDGGIEMLFDLKRDPGEHNNLSYQQQQVVKEARARLEQWEKEMDRAAPGFRLK